MKCGLSLTYNETELIHAFPLAWVDPGNSVYRPEAFQRKPEANFAL